MPITKSILVADLRLDLMNFRTIPQTSEADALHAMVSISDEWFWALLESLLDDGYLPTENIIVLKEGIANLVVKEGNRRIAALKLAHGLLPVKGLQIPPHLQKKLGNVTDAWKESNATVPCALYSKSEAATVDRIVTLTHGKAEKAGRDTWEAVAKARHNRVTNPKGESTLDALEAYLAAGKNLNGYQKERWAGDYPLSILDEALKKLAPRVGCANLRELADSYPDRAVCRPQLEQVVHDIGTGVLTFPVMRKNPSWPTEYGFPYAAEKTSRGDGSAAREGGKDGGTGKPGGAGKTDGASKGNKPARGSTKAISTTDPRSVTRELKAFAPRGKGRAKLVTLWEEARKLKIDQHPHAFCFVLRSMFELSAKAFCEDHKGDGLSVLKGNGEEKFLVNVLREITEVLTESKKNRAMMKELHGPMTQLGNSDSILSVTSMNQLIHNPNFPVTDANVCTVFHTVFPLLKAMNR